MCLKMLNLVEHPKENFQFPLGEVPKLSYELGEDVHWVTQGQDCILGEARI